MIKVNSEQRKVGLALSGGGFRASIFHMGVLRRLNELNILNKIDVISTVSGGSIVGTYYVVNKDRWTGIQMLEEDFKKGLKANIRLRGLTCSWAFHPFLFVRSLAPGFSRTNILAREYSEHFFGETTLGQLPATPKLIINATSLNTGQVWKFSRDGIGDYKFGFSSVPDFILANAVGASAAVPGLFAPLVMRKKHLKNIQVKPPYTYKRINLSDGGVRDNQGLTSIFSEKCDYVICSDASGLIDYSEKPSKFAFKVLLRSNSITMDASRDWAIQLLYRKKEYKEIKQMAFFDLEDEIKSGDPCLPSRLINIVANMRTDLDCFSDDEIFTLMYHGYTLLDHRINKYANDLLQPENDNSLKWTEEFSDERIEMLRHSLRKSHKKRLRPHKF